MKVIFSSIEAAYCQHSLLPQHLIDCVKSHSLVRQKTFLAGRVLLCLALKQFYAVNALPKMFVGEHGKPEFFEARYPHFNISHSDNFIALGLSDHTVGLDVECIKKRHNLEKLKEYLFDAKEQGYFHGLKPDAQLFLFKVLWTLRESLIKLTGRGLLDVKSIRTDPVNQTFSYFSAPKDMHVSVCKLEPYMFSACAQSEVLGCLAYSLEAGEATEFYTLEDDRLVTCETPVELYNFCKVR